MRTFLLIVSLFVSLVVAAADEIKAYPTHWWVGMKNPQLQVMLHAKGIGNFSSIKLNYPGVQVVKVQSPENKNYLFVDLQISPAAKPGQLKLQCLDPLLKKTVTVNYSLFNKSGNSGLTQHQGVNAKDLVYLIMPDRFSNGDLANDIVRGYKDTLCERNNKFSRHGGDFKGIINHLDYLKELGVTSLWLTPVIENDMPRMNEGGNEMAGYHGYWFTDHYEVDKRLGGNEGYKAFCETLHKNGMKVIQDAVYNHVGNSHVFFLDPPMNDWFNSSQGTRQPNHRDEVFLDPYASEEQKRQMLDGWFTPHLPDLNQRNPYLSTFLIQHAIWSTQEFGIDAWRVDTYKYCEENFMNEVNTALLQEFPQLTILGEAWVNTVAANAYFTSNNITTPFRHNPNGILDFQTSFAIMAGINEKYGWTNGVNKLYMTLAQDLLYQNPMSNCMFLDNHDMDRIFSIADENWNKLKMAVNWLYTLRGIPQLYYGTEVLMKNRKINTDATVREDFPGGWPDDDPAKNLFMPAGRSQQQQMAFDYFSRLGQFRKRSSAIGTGKMMQYIPQDGLYAYFRYDDKQTVLVIANTGEKAISPTWSIYKERVKGFTQLRNVITGTLMAMDALTLVPGESFVFELVR
jgi:glycosidase